MHIRFNDNLSSGKNSEGDQFSITLDEPIELADGQKIQNGYRGKGEVTSAKKKGMMGQAGEMNVRLNYIRVGDTRIRLRAQKGGGRRVRGGDGGRRSYVAGAGDVGQLDANFSRAGCP